MAISLRFFFSSHDLYLVAMIRKTMPATRLNTAMMRKPSHRGMRRCRMTKTMKEVSPEMRARIRKTLTAPKKAKRKPKSWAISSIVLISAVASW